MYNILSNSEMSTLVELLNKLASQSLDKRMLVFNTACCSLKFQYPINEDKLDELAEESCRENNFYHGSREDFPTEAYIIGYKAGYYKAKEL